MCHFCEQRLVIGTEHDPGCKVSSSLIHRVELPPFEREYTLVKGHCTESTVSKGVLSVCIHGNRV